MAVTYFNTDEVNKIASNILRLADDYNNEINNLFNRLANVPTSTGEWFGDSATFYFNKVAREKKNYVNFGTQLKNLGNKINQYSMRMESMMNSNKNLETRDIS